MTAALPPIHPLLRSVEALVCRYKCKNDIHMMNSSHLCVVLCPNNPYHIALLIPREAEHNRSP